MPSENGPQDEVLVGSSDNEACNSIASGIEALKRQQHADFEASMVAANGGHWLNVVTAAGVWVYTILTLFIVIFSYRQWREVRRQMHIDQRAWVGPAVWEIQTTKSGGSYPVLIIKNTGKTFALKTSAWLQYSAQLGTIPISDNRGKATNPSVLIPGGTDSISLIDQPVPPLPFRTGPLIQGKYVIFYYGTIWYQDIFSAHWHWTQFCEGLEKDLTTFAPCPGGVHQRTDGGIE